MNQTMEEQACPVLASKPPITVHLIHVANTYPQIVWSVKSVYEQKKEVSMRKDSKSSEELVIKELSMETGRSTGIIKKMLVHGEYLTEACVAELSELGADEDFFDAAQQVKRLLVKSFLDRGLAHEQIEADISTALLKMWPEYQHTGKVDRKRWLKMAEEISEGKNAWVSGELVFGKPQILRYKTPSSDTPRPSSLTREDIRGTLGELAAQIREIMESAQEEHANLAGDIRSLLLQMVKLHLYLASSFDSATGEPDNGILH